MQEQVNIEEAEQRIRSAIEKANQQLPYETLSTGFIAGQVGLDLGFPWSEWDEDIDGPFHEFEGLELSSHRGEAVRDRECGLVSTLDELVERFEEAAECGWDVSLGLSGPVTRGGVA